LGTDKGFLTRKITRGQLYPDDGIAYLMSNDSDKVQRYYRDYGEWHRLVKDPYHALEFETTLRSLRRFLPRRGLILDAGGGPGRYTVTLAKLGYEVVLLDITPELLMEARTHVRRSGVKDRVREIIHGSIDDLSPFDSSFKRGANFTPVEA